MLLTHNLSYIDTQVVDDMRKEKPKLKIDKRMTGSNLIDDVLYEVSVYICVNIMC